MAIFDFDLPNPPIAYFEQTTTLSGHDFIFRFLFNDRLGSWFLSLYDQDETPIAVGVRLIADWPLMLDVLDNRKPPGILICFDTLDQGIDPGFADLGSRHTLSYWDGIDDGAG